MKNKNDLPLKLALSLLASIAIVGTTFTACSTSGGKQESVIGNRVSQRDLKGNVSELNDRAQQAFKDMNIQVVGSEMKNSGNELDLTGKNEDKAISVTMTNISNGMTHVEVTAKEGSFQWNQDYASQVLSKIIEKS